MSTTLTISNIGRCIYSVRGSQIMLDRDLASFYDVTPKHLNQQVRRNANRFPEDMMFQLIPSEYEVLKTQIEHADTLWGQHSKYLPLAFTEQGANMISSVLKSDRAVEVNLAIMRAFTKFKQQGPILNAETMARLDGFESKLDHFHQELLVQSKITNTALQQIVELLKPQPRLLPPPKSGQSKPAYKKLDQTRIEAIENSVANHYGVKVSALKGTTKRSPIAQARQITMYIIREKTGLSFRDIGVHLGNRDHTTVLHAYQKIEAARETDPQLRETLEQIEIALNQA